MFRVDVSEESEPIRPVSRSFAKGNLLLIEFLNRELSRPWSQRELETVRRIELPADVEYGAALERILQAYRASNDPGERWSVNAYTENGRVYAYFS